jgi:hypothetical protein
LILFTNCQTGIVSFDYRVSSEANFDKLQFYFDGALFQEWSGEAGWANYAFSLTNGTHRFEWRYTKDPSLSSGLDAAFIDNLILPANAGTTSPAPAHLQLARQPDGSYVINLLGQTNQQYIVQASTNLVNWQNISTNIAVGGVIVTPDPASRTNPVRFYRAVVAP